MITLSTALMCLTMAVHFEARGEPESGQYAVAHVVMNRSEQDYNNVCKTIMQPKQFSWWDDVKTGKLKIYASDDSWKASQQIALNVLKGQHQDNTKGSTFFHATYVHPYWANTMKKTKKIGDHVFYKKVAVN